jgi:tRNA pseudouridine38-40 synthase
MWLEKDGRPSSDMAKIIAAQDRRLAGPSAVPQGLFLWKVYYPRVLDKRCRPL